ncbi:hypothetical protein FKP32DRAFT_1573007 [Trametes sanguinea]|nr:hypothetical protein FKP32DRAFT_1573007 [Trametes sanguinea]
MASGHHALVRLGGVRAVVLFVACLFAFVAETQLSQYVQADLEFRQPYLIFYIVHSSFAIMFPLHLLYLTVASEHSMRSLWNSVLLTVQTHLSPKAASPSLSERPFPTWRLARLLAFLTAGMTFPGLLWFIAVTLAPVTDVTALWNTNAFFAYVFTCILSSGKWDVRRLIAVSIATVGALAVVYGGSTAESVPSDAVRAPHEMRYVAATAPLLGDLLTLVASILYGAYQVLYKIYAALPNDPEVQADALYSPVPLADSPEDELEDPVETTLLVQDGLIHPLPFGLYPNFLTSAIGICTLLVLWIPVPILDILGVETFEMPRTALTYGVIAGIALTGAIFNAGFMVLLGAWGPIVTSVGSLLTIVLVFLSDAIFGGAVETVTIWSILGCSAIVSAFAILAYDLTRR